MTLTSVIVFIDGKRPGYSNTIHSELTDIYYRHRTTLGPDFEGKGEDVVLYQGQKPVFLKMISFAATGVPETIQFENQAEVSSKEVIFTEYLATYGPDVFVFYGKALDQGKWTDVTIRGSRIQQIIFEEAPQKRP